MRLDARTRQLVQVAENALRVIEETQTEAGLDEIHELVKASDQVRRSWLDSYRVIIQGLQLCVSFMFFLVAVYALTLF
jgi:maltodextrin utilization protein YvdJ